MPKWSVGKKRKTTPKSQTNDDDLIDTAQAAKFLGLAEQTLHNWRSWGKGPPYYKMSEGPRGPIRYLITDLREFRNQRLIKPWK